MEAVESTEGCGLALHGHAGLLAVEYGLSHPRSDGEGARNLLLQPALICRRGARRSLTCGLRAGECQARLRLSGPSRRVDWLRHCLFPRSADGGEPVAWSSDTNECGPS